MLLLALLALLRRSRRRRWAAAGFREKRLACECVLGPVHVLPEREREDAHTRSPVAEGDDGVGAVRRWAANLGRPTSAA